MCGIASLALPYEVGMTPTHTNTITQKVHMNGYNNVSCYFTDAQQCYVGHIILWFINNVKIIYLILKIEDKIDILNYSA